MLNIKELEKEILDNKIANNFPTNDLIHEFKLLKEEVIEAEEVLNNPSQLGKELADIVIFVISVSKIQKIDLEREILSKIKYNKKRTYKKGTFRLN